MEDRVTKAVPIRNRSKVDQFILMDGERLEIKAYHTKVVPPHVADAFTEACSPHVVREDGVSAIDDEAIMPGAEVVWLMNTTGNPDSPETLRFKKMTKEGQVDIEVPNPKHEPIVVRQEKDGGQKPGRVKGEHTLLNMGSIQIVVWPYSRKAFDKDTAEWLLRRDAGQMETMIGCLKPAREPSGYEPNDTWELDDLQLYAVMLGIEKVGPKLSTLKKTASKGTRSLEELVDETKTEVLKRLFFRIADKDYPVPSNEEWEQWRAKQKAGTKNEKAQRVIGRPAVSDAELAARAEAAE